MAVRNELAPNTELEPTSRYHLVFSGDARHPYDLQGVKKSLDLFHSMLPQGFENNVLFLESSSVTSLAKTAMLGEAKKYGSYTTPLLRRWLLPTLGRFPTAREVQERKEAIKRSSLSGIVMRGLIPPSNIRDYFLLEGIDQIKDYPVEVDSEVHTTQNIKQIYMYKNQSNALERSSHANFSEGSYDELIQNRRKYYRGMYLLLQIREQEIENVLKNRIKMARKKRKSEGLMMAFGGVHEHVLTKLQARYLRTQGAIEIHNSLRAAPTFQISETLRNRQSVPDELLAQDFLQKRLIDVIEAKLQMQGQLQVFSELYPEIFQASVAIATSLQEKDIRAVCEAKIDITQLYKTHPQGDSILSAIQ